MRAYYDVRAPEYDDAWLARGQWALPDSKKQSYHKERDALIRLLASLPAATTLDVACGTGFLTRHLGDDVVGLDQSAKMLEIARRQAPGATYVQGDALSLPFKDAEFDRLFTSFFYGRLQESERRRFLNEARRVAERLVIVDAVHRDGLPVERWEDRVLNDGSHWRIYKRYFSGVALLDELREGTALFDGEWFVVVAT